MHEDLIFKSSLITKKEVLPLKHYCWCWLAQYMFMNFEAASYLGNVHLHKLQLNICLPKSIIFSNWNYYQNTIGTTTKKKKKFHWSWIIIEFSLTWTLDKCPPSLNSKDSEEYSVTRGTSVGAQIHVNICIRGILTEKKCR